MRSPESKDMQVPVSQSQQDGMLVSVGIPTFNRPEGLRRTLTQILAQTHANLQVIVSDNASTDRNVARVANEFVARDKRVRYVRQPSNIGAVENFKHVLALATGEHFMWAADDDEWDPTFIERCLAYVRSRNSVMSEFETVFRVDGRREPGNLPALDLDRPLLANISAYIRNMQPTLIYGLHHRRDLAFFLEDEVFDFYDCYAVLKLICEAGMQTFGIVLYRAGVDAPTYQVKYADEQSRKLDYASFALSGTRLLASVRTLSVLDRVVAIHQLLKSIAALISHHERTMHPWRYLFGQIKSKLFRRGDTVAQSSAPSTLAVNDVTEARRSYAQSGEDMIADFVFRAVGIERPSYLDIGAHHPMRFSNTQFFYESGSRGVNVEADPTLIDNFLVHRPDDINLNVGVAADFSGRVILPFYIMSTKTLNTFSQDEAERYTMTGLHRIEEVIEVPVFSINDLIDEHFSGRSPDFLSVDVEGLDFAIIQSLDLERYRPTVICVETLTFSEGRDERKLPEVTEYLSERGYFVYADTYINTLYVDRARWLAHQG